MPSGLTGGDSFHLLSKVMDLRQLTQERISENIAHQDTPGYKARRVEFEGALKSAINQVSGMKQAATHPGHFGATGKEAIGRIMGEESSVKHGANRAGNTVNPEKEMARMVENALLYDAATEIIARKYRGLKSVIREGR